MIRGFTRYQLQTSLSRLHTHFMEHARDLPFRKSKEPYRVWISEVMLQQTRVNAMLPAYERFLKRFPDVHILAAADEAEVLEMWQGLGYYRRARLLHQGSRYLLQHYNGHFPEDKAKILQVPGIGPYTAAAILSIACDQEEAVVDGNVRRLLLRMFHGYISDSVRDLAATAETLIKLRAAGVSPGIHNQALMEHGSLICKPLPDCQSCMLACKASGKNPERIPAAKKEQKKTVFMQIYLIRDEKRYLLVRHRNSYFLKDHWFFPFIVSEPGKESIYRSPVLESEEITDAVATVNSKISRAAANKQKMQADIPLFRHSITNHDIHVYVKCIYYSNMKKQSNAVQHSTRKDDKDAAFDIEYVGEDNLSRYIVTSLFKKLQKKGLL